MPQNCCCCLLPVGEDGGSSLIFVLYGGGAAPTEEGVCPTFLSPVAGVTAVEAEVTV